MTRSQKLARHLLKVQNWARKQDHDEEQDGPFKPERWSTADPEGKKEAEELAKLITEAFDILMRR